MGIFSLILIIPLLIIFAIFLPVIAIIDILRSKFNGNDNILMILIVIFIPFGAILYFIIAPTKKIKP